MPAMLLPREFFLPCTATLTLGVGTIKMKVVRL